MRTTLDIADDVLQAAKEIARREGDTAGQVISKLARQGLSRTKQEHSSRSRHGVPVVPSRGEVVTLEHIRKIMDEEGI